MRFKEVMRKEVPKLRTNGEIEYVLAVDEAGVFYVKMIKNTESGTYAQGVFFPATVLAQLKSGAQVPSLGAIDGLGQPVPIGDRNVSGFLKAIADDLLP